MSVLLLALFNIIVIDLVLSGDNAVVIGMAVHRLPPRQKRLAVLTGGGMALLLRLLLTAAATFLLEIPLLQAVGALVLVWITYRLLAEEEDAEAGQQTERNLSFVQAMRTIIIADLTMSIDNVLAVGAAAHGDVPLLVIGLAISMAILLAGGTLISLLINRLGWLNYLGAAVLVILAGRMIAEDKWLLAHGIITDNPFLPWAFSALIGLVLLLLLLLHHARVDRAKKAAEQARTLDAGPRPSGRGGVNLAD